MFFGYLSNIFKYIKLLYNIMSIKELGKYQMEWLNKYNEIKLNQWRLMFLNINDKSEWYYIGNWSPSCCNIHSDYKERTENLKQNSYFYWPK